MRQAVMLHLDRPRQLRYRHAALSALEQHFGCKMAEMGTKLGSLGTDDLCVFLWAGLLWEDKSLTPQAVAELIDNGESEIGEILAAVVEAFQQAFGVSKNAMAPASGTGTQP